MPAGLLSGRRACPLSLSRPLLAACLRTPLPKHKTSLSCAKRDLPLTSRGEDCGITQVKLRGFRVELGEVEAALGELPGVLLCAALVLLDPVSAQRLVAYVTPATLDTGILASELKGHLPAHMVPSIIVPLEALPLLPNEKINRKASTVKKLARVH